MALPASALAANAVFGLVSLLQGFAKQMAVLQAGVAKLVTVVEQYREAGLKVGFQRSGGGISLVVLMM
jgi:hypothetical protein